jgi:hypothetical protein
MAEKRQGMAQAATLTGHNPKTLWDTRVGSICVTCVRPVTGRLWWVAWVCLALLDCVHESYLCDLNRFDMGTQ